MFDKLIRELESLNNQPIPIPIKADVEGYIDRECPNKECLFSFKVKQEDWKNIFKDEAVYCPMCGHKGPANTFFPPEQIEQVKAQGYKYLMGIIGEALIEGANDFNRGQDRNSLLRMSMNITGTHPRHYILPISAKNEFERKLKCQVCNINYAVIGSAFFCPCCGDNSVEQTFDESFNKVEIKLQNIPIIRKAIEVINKDQAEITVRSLIETGLNDCVVSFQRFCDATFQKELPSEKLTTNVFQRIEDGSTLWKKIFNEGYENWLTTYEFKRLIILFQRRHLLSHSEGLVDDKYLQRAKDSTYNLGQRIVVNENDVKELLQLIRKIVAKIREKKAK